MIDWKTYRKTALIRAIFVTSSNISDLPDVIVGLDGYYVETLEGRHKIIPGNYLAEGIEGEHWPIKGSIFMATYKEVKDE